MSVWVTVMLNKGSANIGAIMKFAISFINIKEPNMIFSFLSYDKRTIAGSPKNLSGKKCHKVHC